MYVWTFVNQRITLQHDWPERSMQQYELIRYISQTEKFVNKDLLDTCINPVNIPSTIHKRLIIKIIIINNNEFNARFACKITSLKLILWSTRFIDECYIEWELSRI